MELKLRKVMRHRIRYIGSNRTFMELKSSIYQVIYIFGNRSNRTFMELKLQIFFFVYIIFTF